MKNLLIDCVKKYLVIFPNEKTRQEKLMDYLNTTEDSQITDWNNFNGHIVASGFVYAKKEKKFLVLWHKDMKMYLYPGGHVDNSDSSILMAAQREVEEETGLKNANTVGVLEDSNVPFDIDTHIIKYNERLNLPEHYHFDFRYLFTIERIEDIKVDDEMGDYHWIDINQLEKDTMFGSIASKIRSLLIDDL